MTAPLPAAALDRRGFLRLSLAASAGLATLGFGATLAGCSRQSGVRAAGMRWLTEADCLLLRPVIAAVAGPALPTEAAAAQALVDEGLRRADVCLDALGAAAQAELRKLFDLLQWPPFRRFAGGLARPWDEAGAEDAGRLLARLRASRFALLNGAYRVLVKLGAGGFWSQPATYAASHYPGPPAWAVAALDA